MENQIEQHLLKDIISKRYQILQNGIVLNKKTNKELKFHKDSKGYMKTRIYCPEISNHKDGRKPIRLHRLIALFHLDDYCETKQVNHKNGIKTDNHFSNLEMVTNQENVLHAWNKLDSTERKNKLNNNREKNGKFGKSNRTTLI